MKPSKFRLTATGRGARAAENFLPGAHLVIIGARRSRVVGRAAPLAGRQPVVASPVIALVIARLARALATIGSRAARLTFCPSARFPARPLARPPVRRAEDLDGRSGAHVPDARKPAEEPRRPPVFACGAPQMKARLVAPPKTRLAPTNNRVISAPPSAPTSTSTAAAAAAEAEAKAETEAAPLLEIRASPVSLRATSIVDLGLAV